MQLLKVPAHNKNMTESENKQALISFSAKHSLSFPLPTMNEAEFREFLEMEISLDEIRG